MKYDIFISYRRDGGEYTARILRDKLTELGYSVFFDVESLRSGDFNAELYNVIENCSDFVIVLSPNALDRCVNQNDWVKKEIEHAIKCGKNIVPVLMRGFSFPENLPQSISSLPKYNGIEANSQFFDAFIKKLQEFLVAKPPVVQRVKQNPLFRKTLPLILAAVVVLAGFFGIKSVVDKTSATYPRTDREKNLTESVILSVTADLTNIVIAADYSYDFLNKAENYITANETNYDSIVLDYQILRSGTEEIKDSILPVDQSFADSLQDSPFSLSDIKSFNGQSRLFCEEWLQNAEYIKYLVSDECYLSRSEKLEVISLYRTILDESMDFYSQCYVNGILAPVTDISALDVFFTNLANTSHHTITRENWTADREILTERIEHSLNSMDAAIQQFSLITGGENSENAEIRKNMVQTYMMLGYSKEEAQQMVADYQQKVDAIISKSEEIRYMCQPAEGDDMDTLWYKMTHLLALGYSTDAYDCVDAFYAIAKKKDIYAEKYVRCLNCIIGYMDSKDTVVYGVMVTGYADEEHPVLEIGDIITAFNGQPCHSFEQYTEYKNNVTADSYTLDIIRTDKDNILSEISIAVDMSMPPVALSTLVYSDISAE